MLFKEPFDSLTCALEQAPTHAIFPVHGIRADCECTCGRADCGNSAGKHPACVNGVRDATTDPTRKKALWGTRKNLNIGLATGAPSGVWVLDVDGDEGEKTLAALTSKHTPLPVTLESRTGRGRHLFFLYPGKKIKNRVAIGPKIDVRGDGGYVVIPPSRHRSGACYEYVDSTVLPANAPAWLVEFIAEEKRPVAKTASTQKSSADWLDLVQGVKEGQRNNTVTRLAGKLLSVPSLDPQVSLELILAFNDARCKPPLSHDEVARTVNSIAGHELEKRKGRRAKH